MMIPVRFEGEAVAGGVTGGYEQRGRSWNGLVIF